MEKKILNALRETPGMRAGTIAFIVRENKMKVINALSDMERDGKVYSKTHCDMANMERYSKWYAK